ncbi:MAG: TetR/AcrR family transcriptional regulator [Chloroflexi bacterium]|nr:TetR/AcrR family transcriptional regulator [Chloroflexota bacterium]
MPGTRQAPDRALQRARTRAAILDCAVTMLRQGRQPTVAAAAEAAGVHRATAYRYFPTPQSLLTEAALTLGDPDPDETYRGVRSDDALRLMDAGVRAVTAYMFREEALFRSIVQLTIERWFAQQAAHATDPEPIRETRRFRWIDRALEPLADTLNAHALRRLRSALALVFGAEALIVTRDVAGLVPDEATEVMCWAAATLISGACAQPDALRRGCPTRAATPAMPPRDRPAPNRRRHQVLAGLNRADDEDGATLGTGMP